ncbi:putative F-box/LRR-repeat protein At3g18150 [Quercus robur]|uniref:putative F-box/LRR-repeat protein At3g18150 n=1 Tax=Quercus robur TaxID=38942 RepID=UPI0021628440|nr:putative F-box/LRR-repeat protein At3g18150 [Quercus robur]
MVLWPYGFLILWRRYCPRGISELQTVQDSSAAGFSLELLANARFVFAAAKLGTAGLQMCRSYTFKEGTNNFDNSTFMGEGSYGKDLKDLISQLPDEILVHMLSFLTLEEAVRTSVLSHRWKRSNLDEFRVRFEFNKDFKDLIDGWVDFAISKGVKRLELDFSPTWACVGPKRYTFPHDRFSVGLSCIKSLTSLTLLYVHVTGELLECFLSNCPLLERLYVSNSEDIVNLKIWGSTLRLKYLHIIQCSQFESIEVFAPNLESFGLVGGIETHVNYAPRLRDVHMGGCEPVKYAICPLSNYLSQLQSLVLNICISPYVKLELPKFQTLTNLRRLKWRVIAFDVESLISLIPMIEAAPFLQKFNLELSWCKPLKKKRIKEGEETS